MKKFYLPLSIACLLMVALVITSFKSEDKARIKAATTVAPVSAEASVEESKDYASEAARLYEKLDLERLGLKQEALEYALKGYERLVAEGRVQNADILSVADFSQTSSNKRLYIIDLKRSKLLKNTYVAHGRNSGLQFAEKFSNTPESLQSSLGFYVTKSVYYGKHGRSLRLGGLDGKFNDKAEARAIVIHGATYIGDNRKGAPYQGRSFGCPAVPQHEIDEVIDFIEGGSTFFIYKPVQNYLDQSPVLN